jgi:hypothetical protein
MPEPEPLTPSGNLTLVDDAFTNTIEDKQFMTVETKNGNYFNIVIDKAGQSDNVHFLNLVDEHDLFALLEDDVVIPEPTEPEPYVSPMLEDDEPEPEPEPESGSGNIIAVVVFILLAWGGAGFYFKVLKPKQAANSGGSITGLDEINLDADEDEFEEYDDEDTEDDTEEETEDPTVDDIIDEFSDKEDSDTDEYEEDED